MKRLIGATVILLLLAVLTVGGTLYEQGVFGRATEEMNAVIRYCHQNQPHAAAEHTALAAREWEQNHSILMMLLSHGAINQICDDLHNAELAAEKHDLTALEHECRKVQHALHHVSDKEQLRLHNIL